MTSRLEDRYRRLLRVLPAWYRAEREREMVDVFLEERGDRADADLDAEHGWPGWGEAAAVAGLAVRTRVGGDGAPPGPRAVGDTVRAAAGVGVLLGAAGAAAGLLGRVVATVAGPPQAAILTEGLLHPVGAGWWSAVALVLGLCWLPAWTALTSGRQGVAILLALAACTPSLVGLVLADGGAPIVLWRLGLTLVDLATVVLLVLGPPPRRRPAVRGPPVGPARRGHSRPHGHLPAPAPPPGADRPAGGGAAPRGARRRRHGTPGPARGRGGRRGGGRGRRGCPRDGRARRRPRGARPHHGDRRRRGARGDGGRPSTGTSVRRCGLLIVLDVPLAPHLWPRPSARR
jgi:hypothetical protein